MAASDQIRQMVNFILQEAHEKANEIRVKVCWVSCSDEKILEASRGHDDDDSNATTIKKSNLDSAMSLGIERGSSGWKQKQYYRLQFVVVTMVIIGKSIR